MSKPSSIEWLENQLKERYSLMNSEPLFEQAKAMHKEEIIETWIDGVSGWHYKNSEHYYNEVYLGIIKEQE
jgi:hypothetical protein